MTQVFSGRKRLRRVNGSRLTNDVSRAGYLGLGSGLRCRQALTILILITFITRVSNQLKESFYNATRVSNQLLQLNAHPGNTIKIEEK
jgi:hypothetical protein